MIIVWVWMMMFGIWPLARPRHTTPESLLTWVDLMAHLAGFALAVRAIWRRANAT